MRVCVCLAGGGMGAYPTACLACCKMCVKFFFFFFLRGIQRGVFNSANPFSADCQWRVAGEWGEIGEIYKEVGGMVSPPLSLSQGSCCKVIGGSKWLIGDCLTWMWGSGRREREGGGQITALSCHSKLTRWWRSAQLHTDLFILAASPACLALARLLYLPTTAAQPHWVKTAPAHILKAWKVSDYSLFSFFLMCFIPPPACE